MNQNCAIEIKEVVKNYGDQRAVDGVSLDIQIGECFGLLGPNGAGKTSMMKMMYGSSLLSDGEMYVLGLNVRSHMREIKSRIGVVPQEDGLDPDFTVLENLLVFASYHEMPDSEARVRSFELLKWLRLDEYANRGVETLSGGMKRRLAIARSLLNRPELIFLDEPTTGLDPQARSWIWDFFQQLKKQKFSVVLTTHYMEEAERMCDRVAIMDHGKILTIGTPQTLIQGHIGREVVEFDAANSDVNYYLGRLNSANFASQLINNTVSVFVREGQSSKTVLDLIAGDRITIRRPTLNDVFLKLAGSNLRDEN